MRVLVAEDERDLNQVISQKLTAEGYSVDQCYDGEDALYHIEQMDYDAVVLDVMMPRTDGFMVLKKVRSAGNKVPIIMLTARDAISDRVRGLDAGANDYLVKPFSFDELMARLRSITRAPFGMVTNKLQADDLVMDCTTRRVRRGDQEISLSSREFSILEYLLRNKGIVLSRESIENHIWNYDYEGGTNVVDVYISYLRKKIDEGRENKLIRTVRGSGYVIREDT